MKTVSKLGIGLYQGEESDLIDARLLEILEYALVLGINLVDCAPSYRNRRSEKVLGTFVRRHPNQDLFISTKGSFVPFDFSQLVEVENRFVQDLFEKGWIRPELFDQEFFQTFDWHYLDHLFANTLQTISRDYVDVYYLHNPEYFLAKVGRQRFIEVMKEVFIWLKKCIEIGQIRAIGIASWHGFFNDSEETTLQLLDFVQLSEDVGIRTYFKFVQVPFNFSQTKALFCKSQVTPSGKVPLVRLAQEQNLTLHSSAPLGQGKLPAYSFPKEIREIYSDMKSAQISLSFVLSAPCISSTLVGTTSLLHFKELASVYFKERYSDRYFIDTLNQ
jgi:aryl-alcohol dehydrogenase-like predicted oxidoreductase